MMALPKSSAAFLTTAVFVCSSLPASTQDPNPPHHKVRLSNFQPIQMMLRLLFTSTGKKCVIDDDVQGMMDESEMPSDVSFEQALHLIMRYADPPIRYDIKGDVYHFHVKHLPKPSEVPQRITLHFTGSVRDALIQLFQQAKLDEDDLRLNPGVQGNVTVDLKDVSFSTALKTLLDSANPPLTYELKGRYLISVKPPAAPTQK